MSESITHQVCPESAHQETHHLVPTGPAKARVMRCAYCHKTDAELRAEAGA